MADDTEDIGALLLEFQKQFEERLAAQARPGESWRDALARRIDEAIETMPEGIDRRPNPWWKS
jgi:hypothetical protein